MGQLVREGGSQGRGALPRDIGRRDPHAGEVRLASFFEPGVRVRARRTYIHKRRVWFVVAVVAVVVIVRRNRRIGHSSDSHFQLTAYGQYIMGICEG